jgi:HEAT repeat protein
MRNANSICCVFSVIFLQSTFETAMKFIPQNIKLLKKIAIFIGLGFISGTIFLMGSHWWRNGNSNENLNNRFSHFETSQLREPKLIEPDDEFHYNLIGEFPAWQLQEHWDNGHINEINELANDSIIDLKQKMFHTIDRLVSFRSVRSFWQLKTLFEQAKKDHFLVPQFRTALYVIQTPPQLQLSLLKGYYDADILHLAAIKLGQLGYHEAVELLIESLNNPSWEIRSRAVPVLAHLDVKKAAKPLVELLQDPNEVVLLNTINALVQLNVSEAVYPLIQLLNHVSERVRRRVAEALGELGAKEAIGPLINLVHAYNEDSLIAMKALVKLRATEAINPLFGLWKNIDWNDHDEVIKALELLGAREKLIKQLFKLLKDKNPDIRQRAVSGLGLLQAKEAIKPLIELLDDSHNEVRRTAARWLGNLSGDSETNLAAKDAIKPLIKMLNEPNSYTRSTAIWALRNLEAKEAIGSLMELLKEPDEYIYDDVAYALSHFGAQEAILPLIELIPRIRNRENRRRVKKALFWLARNTSIQPFLHLLNSPARFVRYQVTDILGQLGTDEIIKPLIGLLDDKEKIVRYRATQALGQLGATEAVNPLIKLLSDQESLVQNSAVIALGQLGDREAIKPLIQLLNEPSKYVRYEVIYALGQLGAKEAVKPLIALLNDQRYPNNRIRAAKMLGQLGAIEAIKPLIELLSVHEAKDTVASILGQLEAYEATELLIELVDGKNNSAMKALIQLGATEAIKPFIESQRRIGYTIYPFIDLLKDANPASHRFAILALGQSGVEKMNAILIESLKEQDWISLRNGAKYLGRLGVREAIQPLMKLLKDENIFIRKNAISTLSELGIMTEALSIEMTGLEKKSRHQRIKQRQTVAKRLGQIFSQQSVHLLMSLLKDDNLLVKTQAIISLGNLGERQPQLVQPTLSHLYSLLSDSNIHICRTALETVGKIAPELSEEQNTLVEKLTHIIHHPQEILAIRIMALQILGKIGTEAVVDTIINNIQQEIGRQGNHSFILTAFRALGNLGYPKALDFLQSQLDRLEKRKPAWRRNHANKAYNKNRWDYSQWETELGYAIAQIDPKQAGIELLSHELAEVRKGAWIAIGQIGDIVIVKMLIQQYYAKKPYQAHFRQAAYRAIDKSLITIEVHGKKQDLAELKKLFSAINHPGIKTRMDWTIQQLEYRLKSKINAQVNVKDFSLPLSPSRWEVGPLS